MPLNLTILADGESVGQIQVTQTFSTQVVDLPPLANNVAKLTFHSDHPDRVISVSRIGLRGSR